MQNSGLVASHEMIGQAWEGVSVSTIEKCFAMAGFLAADRSIVSFSKEQNEIDPFADLDNELTQVNALLKESSDILMQYCIFDLICTEPLNRDTPLIWTKAMVPSVSVLTGFDCIICQSAKFYPILPKETREAYVKMTRH